jgi:hypothetical protein
MNCLPLNRIKYEIRNAIWPLLVLEIIANVMFLWRNIILASFLILPYHQDLLIAKATDTFISQGAQCILPVLRTALQQ